MEIKLRARLKAYGKLNVSQIDLPAPSLEDAGKFLGVGMTGNYALFENAEKKDIDNLFDGTNNTIPEPDESVKNLIDSLFG